MAKWKISYCVAFTRIYLLPMIYAGRHEIPPVFTGHDGPTWAFSVGWLFLTIDLNRYQYAVEDVK